MSEPQTGSWVGVRFPRLSIITCSLSSCWVVLSFKSLSELSPPNLLLFFDRGVLPRASGSITDVRITSEGTGAADANAHMLHIYDAQRTIDWSTMEDFSTILIIWHWCSSKAKTTLSHHRWLPPLFCQSLKFGSCSLIRYNRSISLFQFWTTNAKKHNVILLLSATKSHNFWPLWQDIKILKTDLYYSLFFNPPCNLSQCPYSSQVHGHQPSWGWEEACFVKEALSQPLLEAVTRHKESIQGRQIKGHTGGARVHRRGEKFNKFGGVLSPSFSSSLILSHSLSSSLTLSHISSTFSSWFFTSWVTVLSLANYIVSVLGRK